MNLSRRSFLFGVGAATIAAVASSPLFPVPPVRFTIADLREGDQITIAGVLDPATGRPQIFRILGKTTSTIRLDRQAMVNL